MRTKLGALLAASTLVLLACGSTGGPRVTGSKQGTGGTSAATSTSTKPGTTVASSTEPPTSDSTPDTSTSDTHDTTLDTTAPTDTSQGASTTTPTTSGGTDTITWEKDSSDPQVDTAHLEVPIDYDDPSKGTFDLYLARHRAKDQNKKIGSLLVNPGGPGFGGTDFAFYAEQVYSNKLLSKFDIVAWDPRGTGQSSPAIDCIDDYDKYFAGLSVIAKTPEQRQKNIDLTKELETLCATKNDKILQYVGTNNSARDMDSIRKALGEDKISYFGFSYGSELGATWATLFPDTVRAAVLDGAADPTADFLTSGLQQAQGFEGSIDQFLKQCSESSSCAFNNGGNAAKAFDDLMSSLDDNPIPSESGRPPVNHAVALTAVAEAMYSESRWGELETALADAQKGEGAGLLTLYDDYYQRRMDGTYDNSLEAFQTISCMDTKERPTVEEEDAEAPKFQAVAPRFAPGNVGSYFCTFFPPAQDPRVDITGKGAGPILVVGTTGDPATPLASTKNMVSALEQGVLLTVDANQHTGYGVNQCSYDAVDNYLIDLKVPAEGTVCK